MKVLLVDDEPDILEQGEAFLEREDGQLEVETASSVRKALNRMEGDDYDAVVSGYRMPGMDGLEFLEVIREDRNSDVPFIIFTGGGREEVAMKALKLGANRYLRKGDDPKSQYRSLARAIVQEVEHSKGEKALQESEERFRSIVNHSKEAIATGDREGRITYWNEGAESIFGYSSDEIVGE